MKESLFASAKFAVMANIRRDDRGLALQLVLDDKPRLHWRLQAAPVESQKNHPNLRRDWTGFEEPISTLTMSGCMFRGQKESMATISSHWPRRPLAVLPPIEASEVRRLRRFARVRR